MPRLSGKQGGFELKAMSVTGKVSICLDRCGEPFIVAAGFMGVAVLGIINYATGVEISFFPLAGRCSPVIDGSRGRPV
jgi:hypothetical protein